VRSGTENGSRESPCRHPPCRLPLKSRNVILTAVSVPSRTEMGMRRTGRHDKMLLGRGFRPVAGKVSIPSELVSSAKAEGPMLVERSRQSSSLGRLGATAGNTVGAGVAP
jgi:hypothetical protein